METSDWISIGSLVIAVVAICYSFLSNTKKYELTDTYRKELLSWYETTLSLLIRLRFLTEQGCLEKEMKCELLADLSAQIDIGRFYFPNVDRGDSLGSYKPVAFKGHRHVALEFLVFSYDLFLSNDAIDHLKDALKLQRHFTSYIFTILRPSEFNKLIKKNTSITFDAEKVLSEYLKNNKTFLEPTS